MKINLLRVAAWMSALLLLTAGGASAQATSPFTVLSNNADTANNYLYVELMYEKSACRDYEARFFRTSRNNPNDSISVKIVEFLNNLGTFETDTDSLSLKRPTAGGYRLKFELPDVPNAADSGYRICVKSYTLAYKCVGCAAGGSDAIFADADIDPSCPYAQAMRNAADAPLLLACYRRESREGNWEAWVQDQRDCKPYRVVAMPDGRWWMAQNLNYTKDLEPYAISNEGPIATPGTADGGFWCPGGKSFDGSRVSYSPTATPSNPSSTSSGTAACATYGALYSWTTANSLNGRGALSTQPAVGVTSSAKGICPEGWYLPSDYDWGVLLNAVEGCGSPNAASSIAPCNHVRSDMTVGYMGSPTSKSALKSTRSCPPHSGKADSVCAKADNPSWNWRRTDYNGKISTPLALGNDRYGFAALPAGYRLGNGASFDMAGVRASFWAAGQNGSNGFSRSLVNIDKNIERGTYAKQHGMSVRCVGAAPLDEFFVFPYGNANTLMLNTDASLLMTCSDGYTNYNWSVTPTDGISYTSTNNNSLTITNTSGSLTVGQKYTVTVTASKGGDSFVASKIIEITALPPVVLPTLGLAGIYTSPNTAADKGVALTLSAYSAVQPAGASYKWTAKANTAGAPAWNLGNTTVPVLNTTTPAVSGISSYTISVTMTAAGYQPATASVEYTVRGCEPIINGTLTNVTVCPGASLTLSPGAATGGDGSSYAYQWQSKTSTSAWTNITSNGNSASYVVPVPAAPSSPVFYRRKVTSCGVTTDGGSGVTVNTYSKPSQTPLATQYVCPSTAKALSPATPKGGDGTYTNYQWLSSATAAGAFTPISGATAAAYTKPATTLTAVNQSIYYRRVLTSCGIRDTMAAFLVSSNVGLAAGTITSPGGCGTGNITLGSSVAATSNVGTPTYLWQSSTAANGTYANVTAASGNNSSATVTIAAPSATTYYRRYARVCGNTISLPAPSATTGLAVTTTGVAPTQKAITQQNVCPGASVTIDLGAASAGAGTYTYTWQWSTDNGTWTTFSAIGAIGNVTVTSYSSTKIVFTAPAAANTYSPYFRRTVASCGQTLSPTGVRGAYTDGGITQSGISSYTLCAGVDTMANLTVAGGTGSPTFLWEKYNFNTVSWDAMPGGNVANIRVAAPDGSSPETYNRYRRTVTSCGGANSTYEIKVSKTTYTTPINQPSPSDVEACFGVPAQVSLGVATGGSGVFTYQWQSSDDNIAWSNVPGATGQNLQVNAPDALGKTVFYHRQAISCGYSHTSDPLRMKAVGEDLSPGVLPQQYEVAKGTTVQMRATTPTGGIGYAYQWQTSTDNEAWTDVAGATAEVYTANAPTATGLYSEYYRRSLTSCGTTIATNATRIFVSLDCPYKGADLVEGSCRVRGKWDAYNGVDQANAATAGAENWEAQITDPRDGKIYRIVQMPDANWWMAQNLDYREGLTWNENAASPSANGGHNTLLIGQFWCPGASNTTTATGSWTPSSNLASCATYGALYSWMTATAPDGLGTPQSSASTPSGVRGVCPQGWHVTSANEWQQMVNAAGAPVGSRLKARGTCPNGIGYCATDAEPLWSSPAAEHYDTYGFSLLPNGYRLGGNVGYRGNEAIMLTCTETNATTVNRHYWSYASNSWSGITTTGKSEGMGVRCLADNTAAAPSNSTAPTGIEATYITVASGTSTTLTAAGGVLGTNGKYQWSTSSSFAPLLGSDSAKLIVAPTAATTYYVRRIDDNTATTSAVNLAVGVEACPYVGADLVSNTCGKRFAGAQNWEAVVSDTRGAANSYRIVQIPDGNWWFAQPSNYTGADATAYSQLSNNGINFSVFLNAQKNDNICNAANGWTIPTSAQVLGLWAVVPARADIRWQEKDTYGFSLGKINITKCSPAPHFQINTGSYAGEQLVVREVRPRRWGTFYQNSTCGISGSTESQAWGVWNQTDMHWGLPVGTGWDGGMVRCLKSQIAASATSVAPAAIEADYIAVQSGTTTTLTAVGGGLGANGVYQWGTGNVGDNIIAGATTESITPTITANTTFWVRCIDNGVTPTAATTINISLVTTCPYTYSDLVAGSCKRRGVGYTNWEVNVWSNGTTGRANDQTQYPVVQVNEIWWFRQTLNYNSGFTSCQCATDEWIHYLTPGSDVGFCPTGWRLPSAAEYDALKTNFPEHYRKGHVMGRCSAVGTGASGIDFHGLAYFSNVGTVPTATVPLTCSLDQNQNSGYVMETVGAIGGVLRGRYHVMHASSDCTNWGNMNGLLRQKQRCVRE